MSDKIAINRYSKPRFIYEDETFSGVLKIAEMVKNDIRLVTDAESSSVKYEAGMEWSDMDIIFGTVGRSPLLEKLRNEGEISFEGIEGKREVYGFFPVFDEGKLRIIIAGSDKRGTIYGLFHISDMLGVSPLVNWSLSVPVKKELEIDSGDRFISKEPSVLYRGFFINDEWPAFGTWCSKHFSGFTVKAYEGIFEMLLRMKGNYLWPAMWSSCFAEDGPGLLSAELADELGVVMGLSHHEPCLRHGEEYSHVRGKDSIYGDAWNFITNKEGITRFWRDGLKRNGHLENVITVGMRGERDSKIMGDATLKDNIDLIRDVLRTQNQLIREEVNSDLESVPRMLALYKEVEPFYYGTKEVEGLKNSEELEGVILLLCDDNHGYVRSLPDKEMREHKGGFGMYYHFDYHGEPVSYEWINSTYLPEVWEQMTTAYEHGIRSLWIVNVGDLGLQETPLSYFLSLAYDYDKWGIDNPNRTKDYLRQWMELQFGSAFEKKDLDLLTDIYDRYTRLVHNRRPEHMDENAYSLEKYEAEKVLEESESIISAEKYLEEKCPEESKAAFTELVSYNVLAGMNLIEMWIYRAYNHYFASIGANVANDYAEKIKYALSRDAELAEMLQSAAERKWDGFAEAQHIGFKHWNSEESVRPIIETVIPVKGNMLTVGLTGEKGSTWGMEWSGKKLTINEWKNTSDENSSGEKIFTTRIFAASTGDEAAEYSVSLSQGGKAVNAEKSEDGSAVYSVYIQGLTDPIELKLDKTGGMVGPDKSIDYVTISTTQKVLKNLSEKDEVYLTVTHPNGKAVIQLSGFRKDVIEIAAEDYTGTNDKDHFLLLKDVGSWDSGVKHFPVTENVALSDDTPYLEYEVNVQEEGEYRLFFRTLPANPFTFGDNIFIRYSVNSESAADVLTVKVLPDDYQPGITDVWGDGVLSHVRITEVLVTLNAGKNRIRFYAASRENVLERIVLQKKTETIKPKRIYG